MPKCYAPSHGHLSPDVVHVALTHYLGKPHLYECLFDEAKGNFSDQFLLTPIDIETFQLAMEDWSIWQRFEIAFHTGKADISTHPALPPEAERHGELKRILDRTLLTNPQKSVTKVGRFEPLGEQTLPIGVLRALQVQWTEPPANFNGMLKCMRFPHENDE